MVVDDDIEAVAAEEPDGKYETVEGGALLVVGVDGAWDAVRGQRACWFCRQQHTRGAACVQGHPVPSLMPGAANL